MTSQQPITNLGTVAPPQPSATLPLGPPQMMFVAQHRPGRGLQVAGFVLGLLGLLFSFLGAFTVVLWGPLTVIGLILGLVGVSKAKQLPGAPKGLGRAGWILALIGLVIGVVVIAAQAETVDDLDRCLQGNQAACEDI
jgi:hypothetical protein